MDLTNTPGEIARDRLLFLWGRRSYAQKIHYYKWLVDLNRKKERCVSGKQTSQYPVDSVVDLVETIVELPAVRRNNMEVMAFRAAGQEIVEENQFKKSYLFKSYARHF